MGYFTPLGQNALEHRQENLQASRQANRAQAIKLLDAAPPKDVEELIPILSERVRVTRLAFEQAVQELADALIVSAANQERGRV